MDALAFGRPLRFALGLPGRHGAVNALGVLAVVAALGLDIDAAAERLAGLEAGAGRGARRLLPVDGGTALLLDESYNANPASMAAALDTLGRLPGRRIAALGDMLELGHTSPALHEGLLPAVLASGAGLVFTAGPMMRHLHDALSGSRRGAHAPDAAALAPLVRAALRPGDAVLVKGSLGSAMRKVVDALEG